MEDIRQGQHVEAFAFDVWDGAGSVTDHNLLGQTGWREIATGTTIGWKKLLRFPTVTAEWVRVRILKSRNDSTIFRPKTFGLYLDPER
jgi:alpha-L-fucosidase